MVIHFGNPNPVNPSRPAVTTPGPAVPSAAPSAVAVPAPAAAPATPQDGVQLMPADQRKCADFDPTSGICKDTAAIPQNRDQVSAALKAKGLPESEVQSTLAYLDQVGANYAEIGELIHNQLGFQRDANDVLGAIQAYGVMIEGKAMKIPGTETDNYQQVMAGLKDGRVRIDKDTERKMGTAAGHYRFEADTVDMAREFKLDSVYQRSVMFHELIHTRQDVDHEHERTADKPLFRDAEVEAYQAQGAFLVKHGYKPDQGPDLKGHLILTPAMRHAQWSEVEQQAMAKQPPDLARAKKAREQMTALSEEVGYQIRNAYDTYDKTLTADGLHSHHH